MTDLKLKRYKFYQSDLRLSVTINSLIFERILELAFTEDGCEHGGFLIGKYHDSHSAEIEDVVLPRSKSTPMSFIRYTDGMKVFWDNLYNNNRQIYLGEWHSHPLSSAKFSMVDRETMLEISESDNVKIKHPIFLIIGFSKDNPDIKFYTVKDKIIYTYE